MSDSVKSKQVLILANSRKLSGRCVAGIELTDGDAGGWLRPVSNREHGEVSTIEQQYEDGTEPALLELVRMQLLEPAPHSYQTENWILDPGYYWVRQGEVSVDQLREYTDSSDLWLFETEDTKLGLNDRVPLAEAESLTNSLRLIHVDDLKYRVFVKGAGYPDAKRRVQASFTHAGTEYRLYITDPVVERECFAKEDGTYFKGSAYLTVSLGEAYDGFTYKLVAAVIPS